MDLIKVFQRFPDHEACIEHLERVRWGSCPVCPYCGSGEVARKADGHRVGRWNCHACKSSFNVLAKTIFQKTKIDLQKWFLGISLVLSAKKGLSSLQLSRDLDMSQPSAWYMVMRIRRAMANDGELLSGIVEADECYLGSKGRRPNDRDKVVKVKFGRGATDNKQPIIGAVERGGSVRAQSSDDVRGSTLASFIGRNVDRDALLMTDAFASYKTVDTIIRRRAIIDHGKRYVDGLTHTNTIEGFWGLLKRAWYGQHHHYSRKWTPAYIAEACYKYNNRKLDDPFSDFIRRAINPTVIRLAAAA